MVVNESKYYAVIQRHIKDGIFEERQISNMHFAEIQY